jgi:hypothetical protein
MCKCGDSHKLSNESDKIDTFFPVSGRPKVKLIPVVPSVSSVQRTNRIEITRRPAKDRTESARDAKCAAYCAPTIICAASIAIDGRDASPIA